MRYSIRNGSKKGNWFRKWRLHTVMCEGKGVGEDSKQGVGTRGTIKGEKPRIAHRLDREDVGEGKEDSNVSSC